MEPYILKAMQYFKVEDWTRMGGEEQWKYGQILYIYYACVHLGIEIVTPEFMRRQKIVEESAIENENTCQYCKFTFVVEEDKENHMKICRKRFDYIKKRYSCKDCNYYSCDYLCDLKLHRLTHTKEKRFLCNFCQKSFSQKAVLNAHINRFHSKNIIKFKCIKCEYTTSYKNHLSTHMKVHLNIKKYICDICNDGFCTKQKLQSHSYIHNQQKPFKCLECEKSFVTNANLTNHTNSVHLKNEQYKCSYCDYSTFVKINLKRHSNRHLSEKQFKCLQCPKSFSTRAYLTDHVNSIHLKNKQLKCSQCEYTTCDKSNIRKHSLTHLIEKPFSCSICDYKCTKNKYLQHHLETKHYK